MIKSYINEHKEETLALIRDLCRIPAPTFFEQKRAEYCKNWLESIGAEGVYIDEATNVIFPINCDGSDDITVMLAHTDTVFPDTEPMSFEEDEEKMYSPGVGDDTASVAILLMTAKFIIENKLKPKDGLLIVCNSCEEGLGNLKGTRQLMQDYNGRISRFVSLDSADLRYINNICVGSQRYEVEVLTEGGHSFNKFGNKNAICALSEIITQIYNIVPPQKEGSKTTYNVGISEGGTSVNTIAQNAKMLCEYRSDDKESLEFMHNEFQKIFENAQSDEVTVKVKQIGDRPCRGVINSENEKFLIDTCKEIIEKVTCADAIFRLASTDCNIPLSMGVPAVCIGVFNGKGAHTGEEYIEKASLVKGLEIAIRTALELTKIKL